MVLGFPPSAPGLSPGWRAWLLRGLAAAFASCVIAGAAQAGDGPPSYPMKASYLYKFTPFVDWPTGAFEGPTSPFRLCIGGRDPFRGIMDRTARGRRVGDHPLVVVRLPTVARGAGCHLLFVGAAHGQSPQQMLTIVAGEPVLTVADEALDAPGAVVQFVTVAGRLRFVIRSDAAQANGLVLSSKLLALSTPARGGGR